MKSPSSNRRRGRFALLVTPYPLAILVVDDEREIGRAMARMLRGHRVVAVDSGAAALAVLAGGDLDLVLCDVMMPGMSGAELYRQTLELHPHMAARFVFITGGACTVDTQQFLDSTCVPVLDKPLAVATLNELIDAIARQRYAVSRMN
jgi:CheY-like chemotaxis protein